MTFATEREEGGDVGGFDVGETFPKRLGEERNGTRGVGDDLNKERGGGA
jgi:hypothetical protein